QDKPAKALAEKILEIKKIDLARAGAPIAVAYAVAAIPVRYALEREQWAEAAKLELPAVDLPWQQFPHAAAIVSFARGVGAARSKDVATAESARAALGKFREALVQMKQDYWANQVEIQAEVVEAWIKFASGKTADALAQMRLAAEWEDKTEKHPVTPG